MTVAQFANSVVFLRRKYGGWVTSWGRTDQHAIDVGGFTNDPHTWDLGVDMLYTVRPVLDHLRADAATVGLQVIREATKPHDHFQPADMLAGPQTVYEGRVKTWV